MSRPLHSGRLVVCQHWQTGEAKVTAELANSTGAAAEAAILLTILSPAGETVCTGCENRMIPAEGSEVVLMGTVENHLL